MAGRDQGVRWAPEAAWQLDFKSSCLRNPFDVGLEDKAELLIGANEEMLKNQAVKRAQGYMSFKRVDRWYVNTEGSELHSDVISSDAGIWAVAVGNDDFQQRNWQAPATNQGFEVYSQAEFVGQAERIAAHAEE